jgi:uncharacterized protein YjbI with pentapeptide repeats
MSFCQSKSVITLTSHGWSGANLAIADLHQANLHQAALERANLTRTNLENANLDYYLHQIN